MASGLGLSIKGVDQLEEGEASRPKEMKSGQDLKISGVPTHDASLVADKKCRCGCVPNIPSLFEMAELRAKYRATKLKQAQLESGQNPR